MATKLTRQSAEGILRNLKEQAAKEHANFSQYAEVLSKGILVRVTERVENEAGLVFERQELALAEPYQRRGERGPYRVIYSVQQKSNVNVSWSDHSRLLDPEQPDLVFPEGECPESGSNEAL